MLDGTKARKKQQQTPSSAKVMELVSTNRQGVTKQVKRLQGRLGSGKSKATVKDKMIKSAVGQWDQFTDSNIQNNVNSEIKRLTVSSKMSKRRKERTFAS